MTFAMGILIGLLVGCMLGGVVSALIVGMMSAARQPEESYQAEAPLMGRPVAKPA